MRNFKQAKDWSTIWMHNRGWQTEAQFQFTPTVITTTAVKQLIDLISLIAQLIF